MATWNNCIIRYNNQRNPSSSAHLKQVTIGLDQDFEEVLTKNLIKITPPKTSINWSNGKNDTKMVDLLVIEERFTINGTLATGLGTGGSFDVGDGQGSKTYVEQTNASDKRDDLKAIFLAGGTMWLTWQDSTVQINCDKLQINPDNKEGSEPADGESGYTVQMTCLKGVDLA